MSTIVEAVALIGELESRLTHSHRTEAEHKLAGIRKVGDAMNEASRRHRRPMDYAMAKQAGTGRLVIP